MSVFEVLHQLIIGPLKIIMETIYGAAYYLLGSVGGAIIPLSLAVSFLLLPFYKKADSIQNEERIIQKQMSAGLAHIKQSFHGDERYMMQQAYYRINHYKPIYALRSAFPLLLQVPFFIAAYQFLSKLTLFEGTPFFLVLDLSKPDDLLHIGSFSINLLPILMTLINILSSEIYAKGLGLRDRLQLHGMALVFLVLLYKSPSGLVIYWTLNNLFSLGKNVVSTSRNPEIARKITLSVLGGIITLYGLLCMEAYSFGQIIVVLTSVCFHAPWIQQFIRWGFPETEKNTAPKQEVKPGMFLLGCLTMAFITGLLIPSAVINDSPAEFIVVSDYISPVTYVFEAFLLGFGLFVLWLGLMYYLSNDSTKEKMEIIIWVVCICSLVNYFFFGTNLGMINPQLQFATKPVFSTGEMLFNAEALLGIATIVIIIWMKKRKAIAAIAPVIFMSVAVIATKNTVGIQTQIPNIVTAIEAGESGQNTIKLSKNGKNVIVIMMDSAISSFIPYLFQENTKLEAKYDGFTWFPNTISFGPATNTASPGLFGGYEYTPEEINRRADVSLADKQNEALRVMPILFDEAGYRVTVCDPTYANYSWIPDVSIYDDHPNILAFNTESGTTVGSNITQFNIWKRNFFCFSLMKTSPLFAQTILYQDGTYFIPDRYSDYLLRIQMTEGLSKAAGVNPSFINAYTVLSTLTNLTQIVDMDQNAFFMIANYTTHDLMMLQEPDYVPQNSVDNTEYDELHKDRFVYNGRVMKVKNTEQIEAYQGNMAALIKMGEWFDYLRSEGIYDNTRIIIVADHGRSLRCFDDMVYGNQIYEDAMRYNPLFMVKDYNSHGFSRDDSFMTNADTPLLAFEGLIENPINPSTGMVLTNGAKYADELPIFFTEEWQTNINNGNTFLPGVWISFKNQDIFDMDNWKVIGEK